MQQLYIYNLLGVFNMAEKQCEIKWRARLISIRRTIPAAAAPMLLIEISGGACSRIARPTAAEGSRFKPALCVIFGRNEAAGQGWDLF
jgi:hypothetical protein